MAQDADRGALSLSSAQAMAVACPQKRARRVPKLQRRVQRPQTRFPCAAHARLVQLRTARSGPSRDAQDSPMTQITDAFYQNMPRQKLHEEILFLDRFGGGDLARDMRPEFYRFGIGGQWAQDFVRKPERAPIVAFAYTITDHPELKEFLK